MIDYAQPAREQGKDAIEGYMAVVARAQTRAKGRSDILFPILHSLIYARNATEAATSPKVEFTARNEADDPRIKYIQACIENSELGDGELQPSADHIYFNQTFDKNLLGVGATYIGYNFQTRKVRTRDDIGNWCEKTMVVQDDICEENVDFFNWGVSRGAQPGMFGARACYWDRFYSDDEFYEKFDTPFYKNISADKIPDGDWFAGSSESKPRVWSGMKRVRYFWDIYNDIFYVQANGIPIRHDYILDYGNKNRPKKMLPITTIHNDVSFEFDKPERTFTTQNNRFYTQEAPVSTNKYFWTMGDAMLVKPMIAAKNTFGRAAVDWLKASSVHFVVGPTGIVDRINAGKLYGIQPIKLDAGTFDTKSLTQGSNFGNEFKQFDEHFDNVMTFALGRDWKRVGMESSSERASIAAMRQEKEQKRDAQNLRWNETGGLLRKYHLKYNLIQQYYVEPNRIEVNDLGQIKGVEEQDILRDADGRPMAILLRKRVDIGETLSEVQVKVKTGNKIKVKNDKGEEEEVDEERVKYKLVDPTSKLAKKQKARAGRTFAAREDFLLTDEEPRIKIVPLSSFQRDDALNKAVLTEQVQAIMPFLTLIVEGKSSIPANGVKYVIEKIAEGYGWDKNRLMDNSGQTAEDTAIAPPPLPVGQGGMPLDVASAPGGAVPSAAMQTVPQGTPAAPGAALAKASPLASQLTL